MLMTQTEWTFQVLPFLALNKELWGKKGIVLDAYKVDGKWVCEVEIDGETHELPYYALSTLSY
jgi:hypothetical protein